MVKYGHSLIRKTNRRPSYERLLVVCEGSKTEPQYFQEIKQQCRLQSCILHSDSGTAPFSVVTCAERIFKEGKTPFGPKGFDAVYAVFDRDTHPQYIQALNKAAQLNKQLKNDERQDVSFIAVPSNPCFELWLLLHFRDVQAYCSSQEMISQLRLFLGSYDKAQHGLYALTRATWKTARTRANALNQKGSPHTQTLYTEAVTLVDKLLHLKD